MNWYLSLMLFSLAAPIFGAGQKKEVPLLEFVEAYEAKITKLSSWDLLGELGDLNDRIRVNSCKQMVAYMCCSKAYDGVIQKNRLKRRLVKQELSRRDRDWQNRLKLLAVENFRCT